MFQDPLGVPNHSNHIRIWTFPQLELAEGFQDYLNNFCLPGLWTSTNSSGWKQETLVQPRMTIPTLFCPSVLNPDAWVAEHFQQFHLRIEGFKIHFIHAEARNPV